MLLEDGYHDGGEDDGPRPGVALGRPEVRLAAGGLDVGLPDRQRPVWQVDVGSAQARQLGGPQRGPRGQPDNCAVEVGNGVGQGPDVVLVDHGSLVAAVGARAAQGAGVAEQDLVLDGGVEDRSQYPVAGGGCAVASTGCVSLLDEGAVPLAHVPRRDLAQRERLPASVTHLWVAPWTSWDPAQVQCAWMWNADDGWQPFTIPLDQITAP